MFDEASQITVWDAIGAIARGKNVVVVGDPKQMPPTSFFDRAASDEDQDENSVEDLESILDEALAASIKLHRLTGHYRSRHESLIAFSNHRYYGGELVTYPSSETKQSAVSLVKVEGLYQRGRGRTNPDEAKAIVREVVRRLNDPEQRTDSIGVVALNTEQQRLIDDLLDQERRQNPDLERFFRDDMEEPMFVKNLETVQGDQRDVILLSIGYGPDAPGAKTMSMNFGPLNRKGGQRRLNVAITRATSEVIIFASFDPSMIDLTRTSAEAVRDLKHYMEFAQRGPAALGESLLNVSTHAFDSDFEEAVAEELRKKGWRIHTQIGVSKFRIDLGIVHPDYPGRYLAGIECDGATYHRSPSARDRDRVRHAILENLGWQLIRIWSTDYWIDPVRTIDRAHQRLAELLEAEREKVEQEKPPAEQRIDKDAQPEQFQERSGVIASQIKPIDVEDAADQAQTDGDDHTGIKTAPLPEALLEMLSAEQFYDQAYLPVIERLAGSLIDLLGPITFRHLSTKIARAHGFQKTGSQIKKRIWAAISKKRCSTKSPDEETIFWPENTESRDVVPFRGLQPQGEDRTWKDVPYPEKLGLAVSILQESHEDPVNRLAAQIGLGRLRQTTKTELEKLFQDARSCNKPVV